MLLKDIILSTTDISSLLGVCKKSVLDWCRNGKLKGTREPGSRTRWWVEGKDFLEFLYYNPKYFNDFKNAKFYKPYKVSLQTLIVSNIEVKPKLYTLMDISEIFDVSIDSVKYWVKQKWIIPIEQKPSYGGHLFNKESIENFVKRCPRYRRVYLKKEI